MKCEIQPTKTEDKPTHSIGRPNNNSQIEVLDVFELTPFISDLDITTDSVVAKVHFQTDADTRQVQIDWGDLQADRIRVRPGSNVALSPVNNPNPLPDGTYEIFHAYELEDGYNPFQRHISLRIMDSSGAIDIRSTTVTITPRYRVNVYQTSVRLLDPCDFFGNQGDFRITLDIDGSPSGNWRWTPSNNFFSESQRQALPGSQFSRELDVNNYSVHYNFRFIEKDGFLNADDQGVFRRSLNIHSLENDQIDREIKVEDPTAGSCRVNVRHYIEMSLIRPLPSLGEMVSYFKVLA